MIEKNAKRAEMHQTRNLTKIGRCRLFNGLILPLVNNMAAVFKVTKEEITRMNKIMFGMFWFPKKIEPVARTKLTRELEEGGLDILDLEKRLRALMTKKYWRSFSETTSLGWSGPDTNWGLKSTK